MIGLLKTADIFSKGFQFSIGQEKKKRTPFGGSLSIGVVITALFYFIYLMYLYFNNQILPKESKTLFSTIETNEAAISKSLIKFKLIIQGMSLPEFEAKMGKKYITFRLSSEEYLLESENFYDIPLVSCKESGFEDFLCMDFENMLDSQKILGINYQKFYQKSFGLTIFKCSNSIDCATEADIDSAITSQNSYLAFYLGIQQFNTTTQTIDNNYQLEYYSFDSQLIIDSTYSLKKCKNEIKSGLILQTSRYLEYLVEISKTDRYHSYQSSLQIDGIPSYGYIGIKLDQNYFNIIIQYPMITEILTQFLSVFNILLILGIIGNMVADLNIIHDLNNIWLQYYYKQTALTLIQTENIKINNIKLNSERKLVNLSLSDQLILLKNRLVSENFFQKSFKYFNLSFIERIKRMVFGWRKTSEGNRLTNKSIYNQMTEITRKHIDVLELYKDLINIKMTLKLILTPDQYAAIQFCGSRILKKDTANNKQETFPNQPENQLKQEKVSVDPVSPDYNKVSIFSNCKTIKKCIKSESDELSISEPHETELVAVKKLNQKVINLNDERKSVENIKLQNHLEEIDRMDSDQSKLLQNLQNFLNKSDKIDSLSQIDKQIYSALIIHQIQQDSLQFQKQF